MGTPLFCKHEKLGDIQIGYLMVGKRDREPTKLTENTTLSENTKPNKDEKAKDLKENSKAQSYSSMYQELLFYTIPTKKAFFEALEELDLGGLISAYQLCEFLRPPSGL